MDRHIDTETYTISKNFFFAMLDKAKCTTVFADRKLVYGSLIESFGRPFRYRLFNWLVFVALNCKISDEALLHGIKLAENALVKIQ